jgi:DNA-binding NtrC family response regulator
VIVVSAKARQNGVRDAIQRGQVTEALQKPFDADQLIRIIQDAA